MKTKKRALSIIMALTLLLGSMAFPADTAKAALSGNNLSRGKSVTASSLEDSTFPASYAVDGNGSTRWASSYNDNQYLTVDLGSNKSVTGARISWEAAYASQYQIQVSTDNSTWTTVYENYNSNGGTQEISFNATNARYVKLYCIRRATEWGFSVYEFEVYGTDVTASTSNVARGRSASATSIENNDYPASYAVDGNAGTRWASSYNDNQSLTIDLGSAMTISGAKIYWEAAYASQYQIQVSTNNSTWTTVYENYSSNGGTQNISFNSTSARYVKLYCIRRATEWGFSVYEFEVYGNASSGGNNNQPENSNENLALGRTGAASSTEEAQYAASYAFDGNGSTRWSSSFADNQSLTVDLGYARNVSRVKLAWEAAYASQYQIQVSTNNSNWTTVYENYNSNGGTQTINFNTVSARYVRVNCIKRATAYGFSLYEFEVYANANGSNTPSQGPTNNSNGEFKVVGYFPNWYGDVVNNVQLEKYTHVNFAFAIPDSNGNIRSLEGSNIATKLIQSAHSKGVKVLISVGGWSYNGDVLESTFAQATNTDAKCRTLANNILNLVDQYGFDGADIDWEYPRSNTSWQYDSLINYLHQGLSQRGKLLTAAVAGGASGSAYSSTALGMMDWINIMAYDGNEGSGHSPYSFAVESGNYWRYTRNLPAEKVVLGVPFYERPNWASYKDIVARDSNNAYRDSTNINGTTVYYNGLNTIAQKTQWACENVSGIMVWEMTQDATGNLSLLNKICETRNQYWR